MCRDANQPQNFILIIQIIKTYTIVIKETGYASYELTANDVEEASKIAESDLEDGSIKFDEDTYDYDIEVQPVEEEIEQAA